MPTTSMIATRAGSSRRERPQSVGLISYGPDEMNLFHRAAVYVDHILKAARPSAFRSGSQRNSNSSLI
jgi:hypothetical protein